LRALERRALSLDTEDAVWRGGLPVLGFWSSLRPRPGGCCGVPNGDEDAARSRCMVGARGGASAVPRAPSFRLHRQKRAKFVSNGLRLGLQLFVGRWFVSATVFFRNRLAG